MVIRCNKNDKKQVFDYIGNDFGRCAYLYIDLCKYGFDNENVHLWKIESNGENINAIILQYYNGMHIYSQNSIFDADDAAKVIREACPAMVCGMEDTITQLKPFFPDKEIEIGKVVKLDQYTGISDPESNPGTREDIEDIVDLLMTDEVMGGPYTRDLLLKQFYERYDTGFGRSFVRRDSSGKLAAHSGTYAELEDIAVISGGIVRPDFRCNGEYARLLGSVCNSLIKDKKEVISYYYKVAAWSHSQVGFKELGNWAKLLMK